MSFTFVLDEPIMRLDSYVNVPELIRKGMSEQLAAKINEVRGTIRVKKIHDEQFHAGGFNPRPIKYNHHYLLGTLSEHATGMAVDIDDTQNPQLTLEEWKFIETLTGKTVIPTLIDGHNHIGLVNEKDGSNKKANYTPENLTDQLQRYAYYGTGATLSMGLEADRELAYKLRDEVIPNAAKFMTVGKGIAATSVAGPPGEARLRSG